MLKRIKKENHQEGEPYNCKCGFTSPDKKEMNRHIAELAIKEKGKHGKSKMPVSLPETLAPQPGGVPEPEPNNLPMVTRKITNRAKILALFGGIAIIGLVFVLGYMFNHNMVFGTIGVLVMFGGGMGFYYQWGKRGESQVKHIGKVVTKQVNSLNLYPDEVRFEDVEKVEGKTGSFPWECINDHKHYYLNRQDPVTKELKPYILPDQQYYDPRVFAERVLSLPCHRKIFQRRQDLMQKLKPVFAALVGIGIWILILTTTGQQQNNTPTPKNTTNLTPTTTLKK